MKKNFFFVPTHLEAFEHSNWLTVSQSILTILDLLIKKVWFLLAKEILSQNLYLCAELWLGLLVLSFHSLSCLLQAAIAYLHVRSWRLLRRLIVSSYHSLPLVISFHRASACRSRVLKQMPHFLAQKHLWITTMGHVAVELLILMAVEAWVWQYSNFREDILLMRQLIARVILERHRLLEKELGLPYLRFNMTSWSS